MIYNIDYDIDIDKVLKKIPRREAKAIKEAIRELCKDPRPEGVIKLSGRSGYCIRVGNYRIIYDIFDDKLLVLVLNIADRKEIYKKK